MYELEIRDDENRMILYEQEAIRVNVKILTGAVSIFVEYDTAPTNTLFTKSITVPSTYSVQVYRAGKRIGDFGGL